MTFRHKHRHFDAPTKFDFVTNITKSRRWACLFNQSKDHLNKKICLIKNNHTQPQRFSQRMYEQTLKQTGYFPNTAMLLFEMDQV